MIVNEAWCNRAAAKRISLQQWARLAYGPYAPGYWTLRRWAMDGLIVPRPKKVRGMWLVDSFAVYRDRIQLESFPMDPASVLKGRRARRLPRPGF